MRSRLQVASLVVPVLLMKPIHAGAGVLEYLDQNGGCRVPIAQSFPREVMAGKPLAYGKPLAQWTQQDLSDFRSYFRACEGSIAATSGVHDMLLQRVDGYVNRLASQIARARTQDATPPMGVPALNAYQAQIGHSPSETTTVTRSTSPAASMIDATKLRIAHLWNEYRRALTESSLQRVPDSPDPQTMITRIDTLLMQLNQIQSEAVGFPSSDRIASFSSYLQGIRPNVVDATKIRQPITDLQRLAIVTIVTASNPLRRQDFEKELGAGIDFTALAADLTEEETSWLVQMSGGEAQVSADNGIFCRVEKDDASSIEALKGMMPLQPMRFSGKLESAKIDTAPMRIHVIFGPCKVSNEAGSNRRTASPVQDAARQIAQRVTDELQSIPERR